MWKYKIGTVVKSIYPLDNVHSGSWGHVIGFATNPLGETTLLVRWSTGKEYPVHPRNVITEE